MNKYRLLMIGQQDFAGFSCWRKLKGVVCNCLDDWIDALTDKLEPYDLVLVAYRWLLQRNAMEHIDFLNAMSKQPIIVIFDDDEVVEREALIAIGIQAVWSVEELQFIDLAALITCSKERHRRLQTLEKENQQVSMLLSKLKHFQVGEEEHVSGVTKLLDRQWVEQSAFMLKKARDQNQALQQMAYHDGLTGLATREFFNQLVKSAMSHAERHHHELALMLLDLDYFKEVNDTFGHPVGDALLQQVAERLQQVLRDEDVVARLGGDEFAILLLEINKPASAGLVAHKLLNALRESPFYIEDYELRMTGSIGIACYPLAGKSDVELLKHADVALYRSKRKGRDCYQFFTSKVNRVMQRQMDLERALCQAVDHEELDVMFAPISSLNQAGLIGFVNMLSWRNADYGLVMPDELLHMARQSPVSCDFDFFLLKRLVRCIGELPQQCVTEVFFMMPMSFLLFSNHQFLPVLRSLLSTQSVDGRRLMFLIDGDSWLRSSVISGHVLSELTAMGCRLCWTVRDALPKDIAALLEFPISALCVDLLSLDDSASAVKQLAALTAIARSQSWQLYAMHASEQYHAVDLEGLGVEATMLPVMQQPLSAAAVLDMLD